MDKFFILERSNEKSKVVMKTPKNYFNTKVFKKYAEIREKLSLTHNKEIKEERRKLKEITKILCPYFGSNYLELIFNMKDDLYYFNYSKMIKNSKSNYNNRPNENKRANRKYKNIVSTMGYYPEIMELDFCKREKVNHKYWLHRYLIAFYNLKENGNMLLPLINVCHSETVDFIYLGLLLFNKVTLYRGTYIYLEKFNPLIKEDTIIKLLDRLPKLFTIEPKKNVNILANYLQYYYKDMYQYNLDIYHKRFDKVIEDTYKDLIVKLEDTKDSQLYEKTIITIYQNFYNMFKKLFIKDQLIKIHSGIKTEEGKFLKKIVISNDIKKVAEVGMAFGISSMFISTGLKKTKGSLISIDPFQTKQWKDNGVNLLKSLKLDKNHTLIQKKSYIALPELLEKYGENSFDMIFIDGWHTFDYTLVDAFYSNKLVKVGGFIIVDDALHFSVKQCIRYLDTNYKNLKRIKSPNTFAAYRKIDQDQREWNFHVKF